MGLNDSEIFVFDKAVSLGVTLEDPFNQTFCRVVLLVCSLVELVRTGIRGSWLLSWSLLGLTSYVFRYCVEGSVSTLQCRLFSFDFDSELFNLFTILCKVNSVKCLKLWQPNLEFCSETLVLGSHAAEHGVHRVLYQVKVFQKRVLLRRNGGEHGLLLNLHIDWCAWGPRPSLACCCRLGRESQVLEHSGKTSCCQDCYDLRSKSSSWQIYRARGWNYRIKV